MVLKGGQGEQRDAWLRVSKINFSPGSAGGHNGRPHCELFCDSMGQISYGPGDPEHEKDVITAINIGSKTVLYDKLKKNEQK